MSADSSFEARVKVWGFRAYCSEGRDSESNGEPNETLDLKARVKLRHRDIEHMSFVAGLRVEGLQGPQRSVKCGWVSGRGLMDGKDPVFRLGGLFRLTLLQVLFFASSDKYLRMPNYAHAAHASISTAGADGSQYESEGIGNPTLQGTTKAMSIVYF